MPPPGAICPQHGAVEARLDGLDREVARVDGERRENEGKLFQRFDGLDRRFSNLEGRLVGYLLAGSILTAGLVMFAQRFLDHAIRGGTP